MLVLYGSKLLSTGYFRYVIDILPIKTISFDWLEEASFLTESNILALMPEISSWKHLRTKVTPDFHLTYIVKTGEIWGRNQNDKNG